MPLDAVAMPQQNFSHLFPTMLTQTPAIGTLPDDSPLNEDSAVFNENTIDYVIIFQFPTKARQREQTEAQVTQALQHLLNRLSSAGLLFQVHPGTKDGELLVLTVCPHAVLQNEFKKERVRDFLAGVSVNDFDNDDNHRAFDETRQVELTSAERLRVVYDILTTPVSEGGAGLSPNEPYVESVMPLHDDRFNKEWIQTWSKKWFIDLNSLTIIRNHFGEKIAFYFSFVQNYLLWLSIPAVLGVVVTLVGARSVTVWYSFLMLVWSVTFLEVWKRKQKALAVHWGVLNCSRHDKRRLDFKGDRMVKDEVTGEEVPFAPLWKVFTRRALSVPGVGIGVIFLSIIVSCVFLLQLFFHEYYSGPFSQILHFTPTIGYVLLIPTMSGIYSKWVRVLNNWELHQTETSWDYHYTKKIFIANFLIAYMSLFITAWIYIPFGDHVLPLLTELNISHSHEKVDFARLRAQLVYFIVTGQIIGFGTEMILPFAMNLIMPKVQKLSGKLTKNAANENQALAGSNDQSSLMKKVCKEVKLPEYDIYVDYVEMVIQFGYVSMFSPVWPLTSLCCMINNWIELRGDAVKICKYTRRPVPLRAEDIGPWMGNMETLVWMSSITMASFVYLFHPSTNFHSPHTFLFTLVAILLSEHLYVAVRLAVSAIISALPDPSNIRLKKREFKLKRTWLQQLRGESSASEPKTLDASDQDLLPQPRWSQLANETQVTKGVEFIAKVFKTN